MDFYMLSDHNLAFTSRGSARRIEEEEKINKNKQ